MGPHNPDPDPDPDEQEGRLDIGGCIQVIEDLVEEVEGELQYYIPGFTHHFAEAPLVALLQYTRCCDEEIQVLYVVPRSDENSLVHCVL